jgi:hypothetical protein
VSSFAGVQLSGMTTRTPLTANTLPSHTEKASISISVNSVGKWDSVFFSVLIEVESLVAKSYRYELNYFFASTMNFLCPSTVRERRTYLYSFLTRTSTRVWK